MQRQHLSQRVLSLLLACVMFLTCAPTALAESTEAAMMRLMKTEGTVSVTNAKGRSVKTRDDMRLNSGYGLETEEASYAWINLDDAKLVKMDAVSDIGIRKSGKKLDILLNSGNLFFNVSKPLEEDETFHIRTSTMGIGIRGTCGWVKVIDQWTTLVYILEGTVEVTVTDPVTGETKTETVKGGETVTCKVYPQDTSGSKCDIIRETFKEDDIDGFVLVELVKDRPLCDKIKEDSGLDILGSGIDAEKKLKEDQEEVHRKLEEINKKLEEQEHNISKDPVWSSPIPDGTAPSESSGDDGASTPDSAPVTPAVNQDLVMPQTDDTVNEYLSRSDVSGVTLLPGTARASTIDMLEVDSGINVPAGKTLVLRTGVRMEVLSGQTVALGANAHVTIGGAFISSGNLTGASGATVKATLVDSTVPLEDWKQSGTTDSAGLYTLTYSPKGVYTIAFNANGGSVSPAQMQTGRDSRLASLPTPTWAGHTFDGWFTAAEGGEQVTTATVFSSDTTVYAHWTQTSVSYVVTYDANGGIGSGTIMTTQISPTLITVKWDEIPIPTRTGYNFAGWYTAPTGGTLLTTSYHVTGPMTVYAHWTAVAPTTYTVTFDPNGGTVSPTTATTGTDGKLTSLPTPTWSGHTFNGWFTAATGGTRVTTSYVFTANATVYAQWTEESTGSVTWELVDSTLYIRGNGPMEMIDGYEGYTASWPWYDQRATITTVVIEDGVTNIGDTAFFQCQDLTSATIPNSVTSIGDSAFSNCTSLTDVGIPNSVTSIGDNAFSDCNSLTNVTIPNSVTSIGAHAFSITGLTSIIIPNNVTSIGQYAFANCSGLTSATLPNGITSISDYMFYCCGLTSVTIPSSVTSIGKSAFNSCPLTSVTIPNSVTSIGEFAFSGCLYLVSVTIPNSITSIGDYAFRQCITLSDVHYAGTETQWNAITIGSGNDPLLNATKHFNSRARSAVSYSAPSVYTDVPATASYAEAVRYCKNNGIMTGTSDTEFTPDGTLTRAMMVTVLHRLAGKPFAYATDSFADVEQGKWYSEAISWASSKGIVNGYNSTTFGTDDPVTHEQVGLILQRYSGDQTIQVTGSDSPKSPATRAEVAMTLMNYARNRKPGTLSEASAIDVMCAPSGIALDKDGNLMVTDVYGKQLWRVQNRNGTAYAGGATVLDLYGQPVGGYNDASLQNSYFKEPWAIAPFLDGWAVSDTANDVVRLVGVSSVQTLNGATNEKLKVTNLGVAFDGPTGLASDDDGNLYVSDTRSGAVRRVNPQGGVVTVAKNLSDPTGLCWKDGALYIAETGRNRIVKLEKGKVTTVAGSGTEGLTDGSAQEAAFASPKGVAVGGDGSVYVADTGNGAVRVIKGGTVTTLAARDPEQLGGGLMSPTGLLVQGQSLYICDTFARKIFVYQLG